MFRSDTRAMVFEDQDSFVQDLTFDTLRAAFDEKSLTLTKANMESLHIIEEGRYTQLGFILSDQFDQSIKIAAFNDEYRTEFLERAEYSGSVIKQMHDVLAFIARYNHPSSVISGMKRVDRYAYPERSVREAVVNAIVHRDYSVDDAILVSIYRTKITITSPGSLNRSYTTEELLTGVSSLRNKNLANVFYRLDYIESYGTGIPRIFGLYRGTYIHPEITIGGSTFTITLPSMNVAEDPAQAFIDSRNEFTRADLEKEMGVSRSEAVSIINRMLEDERIIKVGAGRAIRYRPNRPLRPLGKTDDDSNLRTRNRFRRTSRPIFLYYARMRSHARILLI